jgi:hypothetical protein
MMEPSRGGGWDRKENSTVRPFDNIYKSLHSGSGEVTNRARITAANMCGVERSV